MSNINENEETKKGFIYLLKMYDEKAELVYKIGRCKDFILRMKGYTFKNIIYTMATDDCYKLEKDLIAVIKNKYVITAGNEYFKCDDENELIHLIVDVSLPERMGIEHNLSLIINENKINSVRCEMNEKFNKEISEIKCKYNEEIRLLNDINNKMESILFESYNKIENMKKDFYETILKINNEKEEIKNIEDELKLMESEDILSKENITYNFCIKKMIELFLKKYKLTKNEEDYIKSKEVIEWLNTNFKNITITKFSNEFKKYIKNKDFLIKQKKIDGKNYHVWTYLKNI